MRNWDGSLPRASSDHHDSWSFCCFLVYDALFTYILSFTSSSKLDGGNHNTDNHVQGNQILFAQLFISCVSIVHAFYDSVPQFVPIVIKHVQPDVPSMHCRTFLDYWCYIDVSLSLTWFFHTASNDLIRSLPSSFQQIHHEKTSRFG